MTTSTFDPAAAHVSGGTTLVLAQRTSTLKGFRVSMHDDVAIELRDVAAATVAALQVRTAVPYSDDLAFDATQHYMVVERTVLVERRPAPRTGRPKADEPTERPVVEMDARALQLLSTASSLPEITADELKRKSFAFYAVVIGDDPANRTAYVRQWNPWKLAQTGRLVTLFGDRLRRIQEPILAFEQDFDIVVTNDAVAILRAAAFDKVFRDIDSMRDRIPKWSGAAVQALPLDAATAARLHALCLSSARVARQVRALYERGFLSKAFAIASLRAEMDAQKMDAASLIKSNKLVLSDDDIPVVLKLIDERLVTGWHSQTAWDVALRSTR